mmetsp:Transcript_13714/g.23545  ORF Transcript_13714/g.23545 Transcript_13714/m.23545 type:complete len:437 (-) Transcript_13714:463-1773(-)|eukprot:CAMPEP_0196657418 /NCGR_PEP_ID=MMETSP1086-20130531/23202_1 /TAXON_ID=77921 /ORGANISM="Cyanoptyche  gloeocystis , Strain SAG4.97" /LENGTH=436 /DNA_ID=CAMNT_0041990525 /DNA_START=107 /DNA_END=1417 /DNA_ORIENTATION=+
MAFVSVSSTLRVSKNATFSSASAVCSPAPAACSTSASAAAQQKRSFGFSTNVKSFLGGSIAEKQFFGQPFAKTSFAPAPEESFVTYVIIISKLAPGGKDIKRPVIIGVAGDSGCGKSTFLRRLYDIFGSEMSQGHTPVGDLLTVICLDDYHTLDRKGRLEAGVTALDPRANNFDLMYEQIKALKNLEPIMKPIYNHETGMLDPPELINPNHIIVIEGLHPMFDERVRDLLDFSVYLDISDEVKLAWKIQRDMAERGHKLEDILKSIEARRPDFEAYIEPQKQHADVVLQILPTELIPDDEEKKVLRVRMVQKEGVKFFDPAYLYDEGSTITWVPCGRKLTCSYPGIKFFYGPDTFMGSEVSLLEMDGNFDKLEELIYIESHLNNTSTKYYGELTQQILKNQHFPGSTNGSGLFQVLLGFKIRKIYEKLNASVPVSV